MAAYSVIDDPSKFFQVMTYVGNQGSDVTTGSEASFTFDGNSDMKPDWMWFKGRNYANDWTSYDSSNGFGSSSDTENGALCPSITQPEGSAIWGGGSAYGYIKSFNTDGFTGVSGNVGSNPGPSKRAVWGYASECLAYGWKANGGTTSTNTAGDINTTVQVNSDAGFSIVNYSPPNDTARTIGHGLGAVPKFIIIKALNRNENWHVFHYEAGTGGSILDNDTAHNNNTVLGDTLPTSTVYKLGTDWRMNGSYHYVGYFFSEVRGFSKFGSYKGNGQYDGQFVYTGFKPAMIIIKDEDGTEPWIVYDTKRNPFNPTDKKLSPSIHSTENAVSGLGDANYNMIDIYANGFKCKSNSAAANGNNNTFFYAAWAEEPLVTSGGIPATAR